MNVKSVILIVAALLFAGGTAFVASRLMGHKPVQQAQVLLGYFAPPVGPMSSSGRLASFPVGNPPQKPPTAYWLRGKILGSALYVSTERARATPAPQPASR